MIIKTKLYQHYTGIIRKNVFLKVTEYTVHAKTFSGSWLNFYVFIL